MTTKIASKILVCEGEEVLLTALKFRLQKQGYSLFLAQNGKKAKELIRQAQPDLIIADLNLPGIRTAELLDFVHQEIGTDVPMIAMADLEDEELVLEALRLGFQDFLTKPFKPVELVLRIRRIVELV
ncbi:MAG TPA: response regulator [Saprospiraceae bacterium]|nr:response regulator [Saprospiraceae bacterium]HMQ83839.1 response regulator [Saprospiraceae bacterium]